VIKAAYDNAGISSETITYIEAHGTGTSLGDPIEIEALTKVFRKDADKKQFCKIGSVKTNIGHLEGAAGMAGIIKVLMMMKYKKIPATLNINTINPVINFKSSPFIPALKLSEWQTNGNMPLRSGVSSFGFGGVNAHVVLEEVKSEKCRAINEITGTTHIFALSAKSEDSLKRLVSKWRKFVDSEEFDNMELHDICGTLLTGRRAFEYRIGCCIENKEEIAEFIKNIDTGQFYKKTIQKLQLKIGNLTDIKKFKESCQFMFDLLSVIDQPNVIAGVNTGVWVALVVCQMVSYEDIMAVISGDDNVSGLNIQNPTIPFYDTAQGEIITSHRFGKEYLKMLMEGIYI
jgi:acyl transferase domain-containing protein